MAKTKTIYAVKTRDNEKHSSIKVYCETYAIALREVKKYVDFHREADEKNIVPIKIMIE